MHVTYEQAQQAIAAAIKKGYVCINS